MFSYEIGEIFRSIYFEEHLRATASNIFFLTHLSLLLQKVFILLEGAGVISRFTERYTDFGFMGLGRPK